MRKTILIVAAHPDDEILGCGGTVARLVKEGYQAHTLILGEGLTSRYQNQEEGRGSQLMADLKTDCRRANKIIGVKTTFIHDFPDNRFDTVPLLDIVKVIEKVKEDVRPDTVFTHFPNDLNIDHRITFQAVLTATRPLAAEAVKEILSFEVLSSTSWNFPLTFSPDCFYDISQSLSKKLKAMSCYKSEIKKYPHPRSLEGIQHNAAYWGLQVGVKFVEAFKVIRISR